MIESITTAATGGNPREDRIIYIRPGATSEPSRIEFEFPEGPNIWEFKAICMRMAAALGYDCGIVRKCFGEIEDV